MPINTGLLTILVVLVVATIVVAWIVDNILERDPARAAERTAQRGKGLVAGALSMAGAIGFVGVEAILQLPELLLTAWGLIALVRGFSPEAFLAVAFVVWLVAETVNGGPAGS